jgi:hypothetical protein
MEAEGLVEAERRTEAGARDQDDAPRSHRPCRLDAALRLYEALGFHHVPPPGNPVYSTADVYMELDLARADG